MNDGSWKLHTGYLVEGLELFIRKVAYTSMMQPFWFAGPTIATHTQPHMRGKARGNEKSPCFLRALFTTRFSVSNAGLGTVAHTIQHHSHKSVTQAELDYNVTAHAQKTIFVYGLNGGVHILLHHI
jgi:hypothetical protein